MRGSADVHGTPLRISSPLAVAVRKQGGMKSGCGGGFIVESAAPALPAAPPLPAAAPPAPIPPSPDVPPVGAVPPVGVFPPLPPPDDGSSVGALSGPRIPW